MSVALLARRSIRTPSRQILLISRAYAVPSPSPIASSSTTPSSSLPSSPLPPPSDYDIVIIGGGVAGLSLAAALGKLSLSALCISRYRGRELNRTLSLSQVLVPRLLTSRRASSKRPICPRSKLGNPRMESGATGSVQSRTKTEVSSRVSALSLSSSLFAFLRSNPLELNELMRDRTFLQLWEDGLTSTNIDWAL